ncbi:MAG: DUF1080 domain-containing protein [Isosphaeraceae bacterium]|nr:DUF1080 domain-containing protein [Isosphaeraceae bacterium]
MPRLFWIAAWVGLAAPADSDRLLFDGRTLDGWQRFGGKAEAWAVESGLLVSKGEGGGWVGTTKEYADFELTLEFRMTPESNSGVYLRAPADVSHISRTGLEIQLLDEKHPRYAEIKAWQRTGAIYHVAAPKADRLKPTGEWNRMKITAKGPLIVIELNGGVIVDDRLDGHPELEKEHTGLKRATGRIGLQSHNGRVEFRDLRIREL